MKKEHVDVVTAVVVAFAAFGALLVGFCKATQER